MLKPLVGAPAAAGAFGTMVVLASRGAAPPMLEGLIAPGPASDVADKMMLFGQLVGEWDIDYTAYPAEGKPLTVRCEWTWRWVLDGRAVQDVWICPSRVERARDPSLKGEWGTTLRVYDKKLDAWHVVFAGPAFGNLNTLTARAVNGEIVQEGSTPTAVRSTGTSERLRRPPSAGGRRS